MSSVGLHIDYGSTVELGEDDDGEPCLVIGNSAWVEEPALLTFAQPPGTPERRAAVDLLIRQLEKLR